MKIVNVDNIVLIIHGFMYTLIQCMYSHNVFFYLHAERRKDSLSPTRDPRISHTRPLARTITRSSLCIMLHGYCVRCARAWGARVPETGRCTNLWSNRCVREFCTILAGKLTSVTYVTVHSATDALTPN